MEAKLNERQKAFCEYYVASGNATESAIKAGYSNYYANNRIHAMLKQGRISVYIKELQETIKSERIADMKEVQEFWSKTLRDESCDLKDRIKVSELIAKVNGAFIEKINIDGNLPVMIVGEDNLDE